jgi:polyhydroxyalkanoate synthase
MNVLRDASSAKAAEEVGPDHSWQDGFVPMHLVNWFDQWLHAGMAHLTFSISPTSMALAWLDWAMQLAISPGRRFLLAQMAQGMAMTLGGHPIDVGGLRPVTTRIEAMPTDRRFIDPEWRVWPFNAMQQAFLLTERWWSAATTGVPGVSPHHEHVMSFATRQWLDVFSPGNFLATNPVAIRRTLDEHGLNLVRGHMAWLDDLYRRWQGMPPAGTEQFIPGRQVAVTPGRVVLRNELMELIQYCPDTGMVHPEPILILPAWIMKYYILDLSPSNSLVRYLVERGFTVFCVSWKNPSVDQRNLGLDDYLALGWHAALDAISTIVPDRRIHGAGYCLGGSLLAIAAAAMARDHDDRLQSMTLFAAQTDFSEPGELALFIDESEVAYLEDQMSVTGYLTARQMAGAFQLLRSYDLLWSRVVASYLLGETEPMTDLAAWNADATRMPARMHAQYLCSLFLHNDLACDRYLVGGRPVVLDDIHVPMFCVATQTDHVAPWRSVYKLHEETSSDLTFVLTTGGHNAGIISEPGHAHRSYCLGIRHEGDAYTAPDEWTRAARKVDGSWWPAWIDWLRGQSGETIRPPVMGAGVAGEAPGTYVLEK